MRNLRTLHSQSGYMLRWVPERKKYMREHIFVAELAFGGPLPAGAIVHHINEDKTDNRPSNLLICSRAYHQMLHARMRAAAACGNPNWLLCPLCGRYDDPANLHGIKPKHRACMAAHSRAFNKRKAAAHRWIALGETVTWTHRTSRTEYTGTVVGHSVRLEPHRTSDHDARFRHYSVQTDRGLKNPNAKTVELSNPTARRMETPALSELCRMPEEER